jgi:hypothetical protein
VSKLGGPPGIAASQDLKGQISTKNMSTKAMGKSLIFDRFYVILRTKLLKPANLSKPFLI